MELKFTDYHSNEFCLRKNGKHNVSYSTQKQFSNCDQKFSGEAIHVTTTPSMPFTLLGLWLAINTYYDI